MFQAGLHKRIHFSITCLIAILLPFKQFGPLQIVAICIGLLLLNWFLEGDFRGKFIGMKHRLLFLILISFYLFHILGLTWTSNQAAGGFDLEVKFSLFVFPWVYSTRPLERHQVDRVMSSFSLGCALTAIILFCRAIYFYTAFHQNKFFYEEFSCFMHPSYFSMYLNLALIYLLFSLSRKGAVKSWVWGAMIPLFVLAIVLLSSKMGMITLLLTLFSWLSWLVISRRKYFIGGISILLLVVCGLGVIRFSPSVTDRIKSAIHVVSAGNIDKTNPESTAVRMLIWGVSKELISEHPLFGVGTGDSKDALMNKYKEEGISGAYHNHLNAHNAYLQEFVSLGLVGLILLLGMLLLPFIFACKERNWILGGFVILAVLNFLPESMLETQAGVMYYGFFNSLLLFSGMSDGKPVWPSRNWF